MSAQSPMISIPKKSTDEVDWTTPIRNLIAQSYGENPENYVAECAALQRCRQDAVRGAGSDNTARDLLYKYYGQIELLELRFSEIRVNFPWRDAFTLKQVTQSSIAYEKASILFLIAATHSSIAISQSRSDPEGLKRAFHFFRTCAGMLTYINENFLHAPSTDLSRDVVKFLTGIILAQATEVFYEKCTDEKKGSALVAKIASQAASMYGGLCEEVKEFMGKGIFDRNWVLLLSIKSKYFQSLTHYHRGLADEASDKHGDALGRFILSSTLAKETLKLSQSFSYSFTSTLAPTLPADSGTAMVSLAQTLAALTEDKRAEAQRSNDLIYNAIIPQASALPAVEKLVVAKAIGIQEVYSTPEVQKTIGQDIFIRLVPLSVHESASVYSEEKAKLVRGEVEKVESTEGELRASVESMGVRVGVARFRAMAEGAVEGEDEVPGEVRRWRDDIRVVEEREGVDVLLGRLNKLKENVRGELGSVERELEIETRDCEALRVKYEDRWTQEPSAGPSKMSRQDLKSHLGAMEAAAASDEQIVQLWNAVRGDIGVLLSPALEGVFREQVKGSADQSLLDLDVGSEEGEGQERAKIGGYVAEIDERLGKLNSLSKERSTLLRELKDKIQSDDVSHLLLLNRRNTGVEPTLFANELNKFTPYKEKLDATIQRQEQMLVEVANLWKRLKDYAGRGPGARKWEEREKRKKDAVKRFENARDGYMEVRDGIAKGLQFYTELTELSSKLLSGTQQFVMDRKVEREGLLAKIRESQRATAALPAPPAKPPMPPPRPPTGGLSGIESSLSGMNIQHPSSPPTQSNRSWNSTPPVQSPPQPLQTWNQPRYGGQPPYNYQSQQPQGASTFSGTSAPLPPPSTHPTSAFHPASPPPPPSQHFRQNSIPPSPAYPPPPPPPSQPSYNSAPMAPAPPNDPYANLGMFNPPAGTAPQQQQPGSGYPGTASYPTSSAYTSSSPPQRHTPSGYSQPLQPQHNQQPSNSGFPPPPPAMNYNQQFGSGSVLPPPPPFQQQQQQQHQPPQHYGSSQWGSYGQSYGR